MIPEVQLLALIVLAVVIQLNQNRTWTTLKRYWVGNENWHNMHPYETMTYPEKSYPEVQNGKAYRLFWVLSNSEILYGPLFEEYLRSATMVAAVGYSENGRPEDTMNSRKTTPRPF